MIRVSEPHLPDIHKFHKRVESIYKNKWLSNNGPLVQDLEAELSRYLKVKFLTLVTNGTLALNVAYKLFGLQGEVITTPFSFVATTSSLAWGGLRPVFADIKDTSLNLDPMCIREKITEKTSAILPVHVYGNPCNVEEIQKLGDTNDLKIIYDAAHAFGTKFKGQSVLNYGDCSILSFHATKLFHTIEGGAIIVRDEAAHQEVRKLINFGYSGQTNCKVGINAKMNEFSAAMGLCVMEELDFIQEKREMLSKIYEDKLKDFVRFPTFSEHGEKNFSYFPIILKGEEQLLRLMERLREKGVETRRYFYPSLNMLPYVDDGSCPISEEVSKRTLVLPLHTGLEMRDVQKICKLVRLEL